jgi:hypothetical protein
LGVHSTAPVSQISFIKQFSLPYRAGVFLTHFLPQYDQQPVVETNLEMLAASATEE